MNINLIKFLSKLKNAALSKHEQVKLPYNKLYLEIIELLYKEGFIQSFFIKPVASRIQNQFIIFITLRYINNKTIFKNLKFISIPSKVYYLNIRNLAKISNKKIVLVLSTNKGLLTGLESKKYNIGGKLLFTI